MYQNKDIATKMILRFIGEDNITHIDEYVDEILNTESHRFESVEDIENFFKDYLDSINNILSEEDIDLLRYYTGIAYREINAILRNNWNYEVNGGLTDEKKQYYNKFARELKTALNKSIQLPSNIITYRGTNLDSFKRLGIFSLQDLSKLKNNYIYESGFTSTSLLRNRSFFNKSLEWHQNCNIEIEYIIPKDTDDSMPLLTQDTSYSKIQTEFLINSGSLIKIIDVKVNLDDNTAYLKAVYIPQNIWNREYIQNIDAPQNVNK